MCILSHYPPTTQHPTHTFYSTIFSVFYSALILLGLGLNQPYRTTQTHLLLDIAIYLNLYLFQRKKKCLLCRHRQAALIWTQSHINHHQKDGGYTLLLSDHFWKLFS